MTHSKDDPPPILANKHYDSPSVFKPESLLREARRQKGASVTAVPSVCLLDPDGDIVRQLKIDGRAQRHEGWVCYHTELFVFDEDGLTIVVVGCAVGASFAVLVAEELFASGCELLISMTSSGQIKPVQEPPYFILVDCALRDEGTSYHYLPPADWSWAPSSLLDRLYRAFENTGIDFCAERPGRPMRRSGKPWKRLLPCGNEASWRRDGGSSLVRVCRGAPSTRHLLRPCDQSAGPD